MASQTRVEQKIWLTAYLAALRRRAPARAEAWANDAVDRFRIRRQRNPQVPGRRRLPDLILTDDPKILARLQAAAEAPPGPVPPEDEEE